MVDRSVASEQPLSLEEIQEYHEDAISSLQYYFTEAPSSFARFFDAKPQALIDELKQRIKETDLRSILVTLAALEASFRIDYEIRCSKRLKDPLSRAFRSIYKEHKQHVSLDEHIFEAWKTQTPASKRLISDLRTAFKLRHWLAHGRYGQLRLGRAFDYDSIYDLAITVIQQLSGSASQTP
jgi:hypothetical protein